MKRPLPGLILTVTRLSVMGLGVTILSTTILGMTTMDGRACAVDTPSEMLANAAQEHRAERLGGQLRCLVCQNESIEDSSAPLARDLRRLVREQIVSGQSDAQILRWMTDRYGAFIRLSPPLSATTALLWFMPVLAVSAGFLLAWRSLRPNLRPGFRPDTGSDAHPDARHGAIDLTEDERCRLAVMMQEEAGNNAKDRKRS